MVTQLRLPGELSDRVRPLAAARHESLNAFFVSAIRERVEKLEARAARTAGPRVVARAAALAASLEGVVKKS